MIAVAAGTGGLASQTAATQNSEHDSDADRGEGESAGHDHHEGHDDRHSEGDSEFNHADVAFMRMMVPHHEQAVEMAALVSGRTDRRELCELAPEIIEVQEAEIQQMHDWLEEAGAEPGAHEMDHREMDGMLADAAFQELRCASGQRFDCLFVDHMIRHHEGAIAMAEDVLEDGRSNRVADLAADVIDVQKAEIETMTRWQRAWGC
ncbi:DUF305 domain-containing protein (plasmid) [Haloferacaceae archaeon DSL9]